MHRNVPEFADLYLAIATDAPDEHIRVQFSEGDGVGILPWEAGVEDLFDDLRWEMDMNALKAMREAGL